MDKNKHLSFVIICSLFIILFSVTVSHADAPCTVIFKPGGEELRGRIVGGTMGDSYIPSRFEFQLVWNDTHFTVDIRQIKYIEVLSEVKSFDAGYRGSEVLVRYKSGREDKFVFHSRWSLRFKSELGTTLLHAGNFHKLFID